MTISVNRSMTIIILHAETITKFNQTSTHDDGAYIHTARTDNLIRFAGTDHWPMRCGVNEGYTAHTMHHTRTHMYESHEHLWSLVNIQS